VSSWYVRCRALGALAGVTLGLGSTVRAQPVAVDSVHHLTASAFPGVHAWAAGRPPVHGHGAPVFGGVIVLSLRGGQAPRDVTLWARTGSVSFVSLDQPELVGQRDGAERKVLERLHDETATSAVLAKIWNLSSGPLPDSAALWPLLATHAEQRGTRHATMRLTLIPGAEPRVMAYLVELPKAMHGRFETEVLAAFDDAMPERLVIKADVPPPEVTFAGRVRDAFAGALGLLGGAIVGFLGFWMQQWYSRRVEIKRQFETSKIASSKALRTFFKRDGPYETLRDAEGAEADRVRNVREALVEDGIYSILPANVAARLDDLMTRREHEKSPVKRLDALVSAHFAEFRS
jgi:hypothetical protein